MRRRTFLAATLTGLLVVFTAIPTARASEVDTAAVNAARQKAVDYLKSTQNDDGSWTSPNSVGVTSLATAGLLDGGVPASDPAVAKALRYLKGFVQPDGGIYAPKSTHRNYETSIALVAFYSANADGKYDDLIAKAKSFLKGLQWDESENISQADANYGGAGYGSHSRPDLSNTSFFVESLKTAGVKDSDPAMQKAIVFVSRCQNLESEYNTTEFASKINDGGFYYTVAAGGSSMAGQTPDGGLRSYGSMTYAGLKSLIYAGVDQNDPRAKAAYDWAKAHYTLTENPGMDQMGLYYYYQALAKCLDAMNIKTITAKDGSTHDWKAELAAELINRQGKNGSWVNKADRFYEGDPNLVTAYVLMTLKHVVPVKN